MNDDDNMALFDAAAADDDEADVCLEPFDSLTTSDLASDFFDVFSDLLDFFFDGVAETIPVAVFAAAADEEGATAVSF